MDRKLVILGGANVWRLNIKCVFDGRLLAMCLFKKIPSCICSASLNNLPLYHWLTNNGETVNGLKY